MLLCQHMNSQRVSALSAVALQRCGALPAVSSELCDEEGNSCKAQEVKERRGGGGERGPAQTEQAS